MPPAAARIGVPDGTPMSMPGWQDSHARGSQNGDVPTVPFAKLEEALWEKAENKGVEMLRGYVVEGLFGQQKKPDGMYKSMALTLREWDNTNKAIRAHSGGISVSADLLVVATGGGASDDPIMQKLGFQWEELKAKNYAAYGIFEPGSAYVYQDDGSGRPVFDTHLKNDIRPTIQAMIPGGSGSGRTGLTTSDHNYLLVTLTGVMWLVQTKSLAPLLAHFGLCRPCG